MSFEVAQTARFGHAFSVRTRAERLQLADTRAELDERLRAAYDENGVDLSLIRSNLAKTPTERVRDLEDLLNALATVRRITP